MKHPLLITGFEPFAGFNRNPSGELVKALSESSSDRDLVTDILPVEYSAAAVQLERLLMELNPLAWIGFGLNQRATAITLERIAVNLDDATIPDNAGDLRRSVLIVPDGAESYRSTLPLQKIEARLQKLHIPASYSDSAGRFVCNHVFYRGLAILSRIKSNAPAGFIHIPWPSDWENPPSSGHSVTFATILEASQACISELTGD
jgi:pyroglutamyl-peptidase